MVDNAPSKVEMNGICPVCKCLAKLKCSGCKNVFYCGREHQKIDWKSHSAKCCALKLVEDPINGRHYVATTKIAMDEIVLKEDKPLLILPRGREPAECLNCYRHLKIDEAKPCIKCGWLLCSNCTSHGPECELTLKYRNSKMTIEKCTHVLLNPGAIWVLRALALRNESPADYEKFMSLEDPCDQKRRRQFIDLTKGLITFKASYVRNEMKIDDLNMSDIMKIIGIVSVNGLENMSALNDFRFLVFDKSSCISHDCYPNCRTIVTYGDKKPSAVNIQAVRTIKKGHPLSINYDATYSGTVQRRCNLRVQRFFDCRCQRCKDPTEFGTMFNAVRCLRSDCNGYMLPPTFISLRNGMIPDYVCDKCNFTLPSVVIDQRINKMQEECSKLKPDDVIQWQKCMDDQVKSLHENHWMIIITKIRWINAWHGKSHDSKLASREILEKSITQIEKMNALFERIMPWAYGLRGNILSFLYNRKDTLCSKISPGYSDQIPASLRPDGKLLLEVIRLCRYENEMSDIREDIEATRCALERNGDVSFNQFNFIGSSLSNV